MGKLWKFNDSVLFVLKVASSLRSSKVFGAKKSTTLQGATQHDGEDGSKAGWSLRMVSNEAFD